ncbi:hypothetical protein E2C01_045977 [Portunus trituberculatus]|uniref:Uncharacterized protein n=1 Tax=Portunus trituberculatus TaxID=210409 RepID=A0A5B7G3D9_PORTR|nr:hypothetical protein [Portunus trituberculatus]
MLMRSGNHQSSWPTIPQILSVLGTFHAYVKDAEKRSAKEKKRAKLSGGSSEKRSRRQKPASEAPLASRFVAVESDLATMKTSNG